MPNLVITIVASMTLLLGMISMVTPIPGGILIVAASLTALICTSPRARKVLQFLRIRIEWFNNMFLWMENKIGNRVAIISTALHQTRPGEDITESHRLSAR